jgi:glycosyltransferase involved in cell wall biosynthesis
MNDLQIQHSKVNKYHVCMIGEFPPPVHGMSLVNDAVRRKLVRAGLDPCVIRLSPSSLNRNWFIRMSKLYHFIIGFIRFLGFIRTNRKKSLYISLSGGYGKIFEVPFILVARISRIKIYIHHHSFAYINKKSKLANLLFNLAGVQAHHIVLCESMARGIKEKYPDFIHKTLVLSNAAFIQPNADEELRKENLLVVGFLSNISFVKGINEYLDVMQKVAKGNPQVRGSVAGPFQDFSIEQKFKKRVANIQCVEYTGPKYGGDKTEFYKSIDVLLFPTQYVNEAEPLTLLEAMSFGVPVIAISRGCIASMIPDDYLSIDIGEDFVSIATDRIHFWNKNRDQLENAKELAKKCFGCTKKNADSTLQQLIENMTTGSH